MDLPLLLSAWVSFVILTIDGITYDNELYRPITGKHQALSELPPNTCLFTKLYKLLFWGKICISYKATKHNYCTEEKWQKKTGIISLNLQSEIALFWTASSGKPGQCVEWLRCLCLRKMGVFLWHNTSATRQRACNVEAKNPLMRPVMPLHLQTRKATQAPPATVPVPHVLEISKKRHDKN